jgi:hypothetical protein
MKETGKVSETLGCCPELKQLVAWEDFIEFSRRESCKSYKNEITALIPWHMLRNAGRREIWAVASIPQFIVLLTSLWMLFWLVTIIPKYVNFDSFERLRLLWLPYLYGIISFHHVITYFHPGAIIRIPELYFLSVFCRFNISLPSFEGCVIRNKIRVQAFCCQCVFICCLLNDAVSSSDCVASINEQWIGKDMEGSGRRLN